MATSFVCATGVQSGATTTSLPRRDPPSILVVVNDEGICAAIGQILKDRYRVLAVSDGQAALEAIGHQAPDLILAAEGMPRLGGLGLLREIRSRSSTAGLPFLLLSHRDEEQWRIAGLRAGADDYLLVPFSANELLARVDYHLGKPKLRDDATIGQRELSPRAAESCEALHVSEARFRAFIRQSQDGIVIIDERGTILEWNEGEEEVTGIPRTEAMNRPIWEVRQRLMPDELRAPESLAAAREWTLAALQEGVELQRTIEEDIQRPDGTRRIMQMKLFAIRSDGDLFAGGISRDVTERKRLEEDLRAQQALLLEAERLAHVGHWERDLRSGRFTWSDEIYRILGHPPHSFPLSRRTYLEAIVAEDRRRITEGLVATARDGAMREAEYRIITPQGALRSLYGTVELLRDPRGGPSRLIGTVQDITARKQAEDALRESEQRFRTMADSAPVLIWVGDTAGNNHFVNQAYCDFFGKTRQELEGTAWQPLFHPSDLEGYAQAFYAAMRERTPLHAQIRGRYRDGEWHWLESFGVPRISPAGELLGIVGTSIDITARKQAEEKLQRTQEDLRRAQAVARMGSWRISLSSGVLDWSEEIYRIFGIAPGTPMTDESVLTRVHPDDRAQVEATWQAALRGKPYDLEHRILVGGDVKWVRGVAYLEYDSEGVPRGAFGILQDVTDRKTMEQALADANRRKDEFLAVLSHELRNPLAPVQSSLYVLARATPGGEQAQRMQAIIERQVSHLTRLVDDLLDVTRISRGKIQLQCERVELGELVRRTVEDHRSTFLANGIDLEGRTALQPMWLNADPVRIAQIIGNLLSNAAKFTPRGGRVDVMLEHNGDHAVLRVRDNGVGISPEMVKRLFEPFMQAERTLERTRGGLGLGLALVKGLAELHGGSVTASSAGAGQGAEFSVRLPLEAPAKEIAVPREAPRARPRRVLIIEDNIDGANSLREVLELDGHEVAVAYDGPDGLAKAREFRPEIVLCDIGLPRMDGYEVARAFRADEALRDAYLVALTGYALPDDLAHAHAAGFRRHLAKPASFEQLQELLEQAP